MTQAIICSAAVVALATVSTLSYVHRERSYAVGKSHTIRSLPGFPFVYRYVQATTIGIPIACYFTMWRPLLQIHHQYWLMYAGLVIAAAAMTLFVWAKQSLGCQYSPCSDSFVPLQVVTSGPYKWIRHPIYTANLLLLVGMFISSGSIWVALNLPILAGYYCHSARNEEVALVLHLAGYDRYQQSSGRFFPRWRS